MSILKTGCKVSEDKSPESEHLFFTKKMLIQSLNDFKKTNETDYFN